MKKLLLMLLCLPLLFGCGNNLDSEITDDMLNNGYTGEGTYTWGENKYVGEFKDGRLNGQATITWGDGDKYVGEYKDDYMHGKGTYTYADGTVKKGLWENGDFMGE